MVRPALEIALGIVIGFVALGLFSVLLGVGAVVLEWIGNKRADRRYRRHYNRPRPKW